MVLQIFMRFFGKSFCRNIKQLERLTNFVIKSPKLGVKIVKIIAKDYQDLLKVSSLGKKKERILQVIAIKNTVSRKFT